MERKIINVASLLHCTHYDNNESLYVCSHCRHKKILPSFGDALRNYPQCEVCGIKFTNYTNITSTTMLGVKRLCPRAVIIDKDTNKTALNIIFDKLYFTNSEKTVNENRYSIRIVLNHVTGKTTILKLLDKKNRTIKGNSFNKLINATYGYNPFDYDISKDIWRQVGNILDMKCSNNFSEICTANRLNCLKNAMSLSNVLDIRNNNKLKRKLSKTKPTDVTKQVEIILKEIEVPDTITRRVVKDMSYYSTYKLADSWGFTDVNVIDKLHSVLCGEYDSHAIMSTYYLREIKNLMQDKGEVWLANKIIKSIDEGIKLSSIKMYLVDFARQYLAVVKATPDAVTRSTMKGNLKELHDKFSILENAIKYANIKLHYNDEVQKLNAKVKDFTFNLATETHELITIGQRLGICVGGSGYRSETLKGNIYIVSVKDINDKYIGCIELKPISDKNSTMQLIQAKSVRNNKFQGDLARALKTWVIKNKLDTKHCADYTHIQTNNILECGNYSDEIHTDYHRVELVNGDIVNNNDDYPFF